MKSDATLDILPIRSRDWEKASATLPAAVRGAAQAADFRARAGELVLAPDAEGRVQAGLFGLGEADGAMVFRALGAKLPPGDYALASLPEGLERDQVAVAFALGSYRFDRYRQVRHVPPVLTWPGDSPSPAALEMAHACALARDMINTGANDMGPLQVESIAREIAAAHGARIEVVIGDALIEAGYPAVHAVGRAAVASRAPRMIEMAWGEAQAPHVVVIGKGVVFDSGGLDIKPSAGMRHMKKDMGGAAHALALGRLIMAAGLPLRLTVLTPVVENAISGDAMRPGDVIASRKGLSIEVGNTDAEGRLILADALARADELKPDLTIDLATLTGAARVALGPQLPPFYTDDEGLAAALLAASAKVSDPIWRMPLWAPYDAALDSDVADVCNDSDAWAQAGSITAALFLKRFAPPGKWAHFDIFAWNPHSRPGWPKGGEVQAIRAIFAMLEDGRW